MTDLKKTSPCTAERLRKRIAADIARSGSPWPEHDDAGTPDHVARLIRDRQQALGWTVAELARRAGASRPSVSRALGGSTSIRSDLADRLIEAMGGIEGAAWGPAPEKGRESLS